jgi:integrase
LLQFPTFSRLNPVPFTANLQQDYSMASFRKRGSSWEAFVSKTGADKKPIRKSATFDTKAEAQRWAAKIETEIHDGKYAIFADKTLGDLLTRYANEVSVNKAGGRWERLRINAICRLDIAHIKLCDLNQTHFVKWRDDRLQEVKSSSFLRDRVVVNRALNVAVKEWLWLPKNPLTGVGSPAPPVARDRLISEDEIERLCFAMGYDGTPPRTVIARVGACFTFAIETAMRASEICNLRWDEVFTERRFLKVASGKTPAARREVALSSEALRIIGLMDEVRDGDLVFNLKPSQVDALFRRAKSRAMIGDLHFHDSRHEAITRLADKLDVLALARMVGHADLRQLQVYYNATAESMAAKLG